MTEQKRITLGGDGVEASQPKRQQTMASRLKRKVSARKKRKSRKK